MTPTTRHRFVARSAPAPRTGFSLVELLVVLAIIGILMALTGAALQKTVDGQRRKSTQDQVFKLQQSLDQEYDRIVQRCAKESESQQIPPEVMTVCDNDTARAKAVWTALQLRLNFPDTFVEANASLTVVDSTGTPRYTIVRPATFAGLPALGDATRPREESGVLLYMILAKRSVSGGGAMAVGADDLTQAARTKVVFGGREFETFSDAYQNSVGFKRWAKHWPTPSWQPAVPVTDIEIQSSPYVDPQKVARGGVNGGTTGAAAPNVDPLDPQNLVFGWALGTNDQRRLILTGLDFDRKNRLATVYSFGRTIRDDAGNLTPADDILGFRLRKQGEKGNKQ